MLNGTPIKDWDPMTRLVQAILPIPLNLDETSRYNEASGEWVMSGRGLLFASGYDTRLSVNSSPDGKLDLTDTPIIYEIFGLLSRSFISAFVENPKSNNGSTS